jgi:methyl-accepting chemotaxis protein
MVFILSKKDKIDKKDKSNNTFIKVFEEFVLVYKSFFNNFIRKLGINKFINSFGILFFVLNILFYLLIMGISLIYVSNVFKFELIFLSVVFIIFSSVICFSLIFTINHYYYLPMNKDIINRLYSIKKSFVLSDKKESSYSESYIFSSLFSQFVSVFDEIVLDLKDKTNKSENLNLKFEIFKKSIKGDLNLVSKSLLYLKDNKFDKFDDLKLSQTMKNQKYFSKFISLINEIRFNFEKNSNEYFLFNKNLNENYLNLTNLHELKSQDLKAVSNIVSELEKSLEFISSFDSFSDTFELLKNSNDYSKDKMNDVSNIVNNSLSKLKTVKKDNNLIIKDVGSVLMSVRNISEGFKDVNGSLLNIKDLAKSVYKLSKELKLISLNATLETAHKTENRNLEIVARETAKISRLSTDKLLKVDNYVNDLVNNINNLVGSIDVVFNKIEYVKGFIENQSNLVNDVDSNVSQMNEILVEINNTISEFDDMSSNLQNILSGFNENSNNLTFNVDKLKSFVVSSDEVVSKLNVIKKDIQNNIIIKNN